MDKYAALLYNEINLICLILLIVVLYNSFGNTDIRSKFPSARGFVISLTILDIGDIFWAFVDSGIIPFTNFWGYFTNLFFFTGTLTSVYFLFMVSQDVYGYHNDHRKKSVLYALPFLIDLAFVWLTPITHLVFYYDGSTYHRSSCYAFTLLIPYSFVLYLCISSFLRSKMTKYFVIRKSLRILALYSLITMLLSIFQLISTDIFPLYVVGGALICVVMYIDILKEFNIVDQVTRLHTRRTFENTLSNLMEKGCSADKNIYLVLIEIEDFESINSIYGQNENNLLLKDVSDVISSSIPTGWSAARFDTGKFSLIGVCAPEEIEHVCSQVFSSFDDYNESSTKPYVVNINLGYAALSYNCKNVFDFIKLAEKRLDEARVLPRRKSPARGNSVSGKESGIAKPSSNSQEISQQDINLWMQSSLNNGEFVPYFQPQINVSDGTISGAEALTRWIHPQKGIIQPGIFIPVFERNGFIYEMDKYIWRSVCSYIRKWKDAGISAPPISVNVSRWDIVQADFIKELMSYLDEFNLQPSDLRLEITESAYLFDQEYLARLMVSLQDLGFKIEMDDFGSGYSSLTAFKDLPFDIIKLDWSLVRESNVTNKAGSIIEGIVNLTKILNIPLIAEGVENKEQAEFLKNIGCHDMQGFLFAKPMPADNFIDFISDWNENK